MRKWSRTAVVGILTGVLAIGASLPAAAQGIKAGVTFPNFKSADTDFENRTGWHLGVFFGGSTEKVFSLQAELNWLRKRAQSQLLGTEFHIDYLQVPVLLRLNIGSSASSGPRVYGLVGPAFAFKIADEIQGFTIDDGFEGADVGLLFGGGLEVARVILEARWEKGFRRINKNFTQFTEVKSESFTALVGIRFK